MDAEQSGRLPTSGTFVTAPCICRPKHPGNAQLKTRIHPRYRPGILTLSLQKSLYEEGSCNDGAPSGPTRRCGIVSSLLCLWASACLAVPAPADELSEAPPPIVFELTLRDAIERALERNRPFLDRRLDREVQRLSLEVAEDRWSPRLTVNPFASGDRQDRKAGFGTETTLRVPTGGALALRWERALSEELRDTGSQSLRFSQPLLKGAWAGIDSAAVRQARLGEKIDILAFREAAADLVVSVIGAYRALIGALRQVEIGEASLRRARAQLEATRALIRAGRVAPREAVRAEATLANRELALARVRNRLDAANFALIAILELGSTVRVRPLDDLKVERTQARPPPALDDVLHDRADYLQGVLQVEIAEIGLAVARNNRLPDLSLGMTLSRDDAGRTDSEVRLEASIPFNDRAPELERLRARTALRKAERRLAELRESIGIAVRQAANDVEVGLRLTALARGARVLAQENLEIEKSKFGQGLASSFEVSAAEEALLRAEQAEVDALVTWLDASTRLDRLSGRTLERWGIRLEAGAR